MMFHRHGDVDHGQQDKDQGLNECDEKPQQKQGDGDDGRDEVQEDSSHRVVTRDVPEEADPQGHGPGQVADDLDGHEEDGQPCHRTAEVLQVADPLLLESVDVVCQEGEDRQGKGHDEVPRGGHETGSGEDSPTDGCQGILDALALGQERCGVQYQEQKHHGGRIHRDRSL